MANETIGELKNGCPLCGGKAEVRKDKNGKLYYYSAAGLIRPATRTGQDWLLENAIMYGRDQREDNSAPDAEPALHNIMDDDDQRNITRQDKDQDPPRKAAGFWDLIGLGEDERADTD